MLVTASVRVRPAEGSVGGLPEKDRVKQAAALLEEYGFQVVHVGRFAVSVRGAPKLFLDIMGVDPKPGNHALGRRGPLGLPIPELFDSVEVLPLPRLFAL